MGSLYHEKQVSLLCGVHALNTLLQGPYFSAPDLGAIAQEFDARERALMREAGVDSADFLRYMAVRTRSCVRALRRLIYRDYHSRRGIAATSPPCHFSWGCNKKIGVPSHSELGNHLSQI